MSVKVKALLDGNSFTVECAECGPVGSGESADAKVEQEAEAAVILHLMNTHGIRYDDITKGRSK